jgi:predicted kinase
MRRLHTADRRGRTAARPPGVLARTLLHSKSVTMRGPWPPPKIILRSTAIVLVCAKVESFKSLEEEVPSLERERARDCARAHFALASSYASRGRPALVIVCELTGTGKSTVSRMLQYRTGFEILNSDRVRKRIAAVPDIFHGYTPYGTGIYTSAFEWLTYHALIVEARGLLRDGHGVIIDATFKRPDDRRAARAIGFQVGVPVLFVECRADQLEVLRRLRERTRTGRGPSDATEEVYFCQLKEFVPIKELSLRQHLVADTTKGTETVLNGIEKSLTNLFD